MLFHFQSYLEKTTAVLVNVENNGPSMKAK